MEKGGAELACRHCGTFNRRDRVFCLKCRRRLFPLTSLDISESDFTYPGDRSNLEALKRTEPLPRLLERFTARDGKRTESWLASNAQMVVPPSDLDMHVRVCGEILGLEVMPEVYVVPSGKMNAFTIGTEERPILVVFSQTLGTLDDGEVQALVAHELAHVKSEHLRYHALAESLAAGANFVAPFFGAGVVSLPLRMLLLAWYRDSEVSADRAALLSVGEFKTFESLMRKLLPADASDARVRGGGETLSELLQTHPAIGHRVELGREFANSPEFFEGRSKMKERARSSGVLVGVCRFCDSVMRASESYCPSCGMSQY